MGFCRTGLEFRMELAAQEPGMFALGQFHDFHQTVIRGNTAQHQPVLRQHVPVFIIEFVTVAVTFIYKRLAISLIRQGIGINFAGIQAQPHGTALVLYIHLIRHQVDNCRNIRLKLAAVGVLQSADIARKLNDGALHTEADAKERNLMLPGIPHGRDFSLDAPVSETARYQNTVHPFEDFP